MFLFYKFPTGNERSASSPRLFPLASVSSPKTPEPTKQNEIFVNENPAGSGLYCLYFHCLNCIIHHCIIL